MLDILTKKRWVDLISTGNSQNFKTVLLTFYKDIQKEWIEQGNKKEDFEKNDPKIVIILDNASFHKKQEILDEIAEEIPNIILEFLPPDSPDYNLMELVWHSAKEYIANKLFKSLEELEFIIHKLLNEGELTICWGRKIKNKDTSIIASENDDSLLHLASLLFTSTKIWVYLQN